jgi:hypothetical protein
MTEKERKRVHVDKDAQTTATAAALPEALSDSTHHWLPVECAVIQLATCEVTASEKMSEVDTQTGPYASGLSAMRVMKGSACIHTYIHTYMTSM